MAVETARNVGCDLVMAEDVCIQGIFRLFVDLKHALCHYFLIGFSIVFITALGGKKLSTETTDLPVFASNVSLACLAIVPPAFAAPSFSLMPFAFSVCAI